MDHTAPCHRDFIEGLEFDSKIHAITAYVKWTGELSMVGGKLAPNTILRAIVSRLQKDLLPLAVCTGGSLGDRTDSSSVV
jgi:hypothetical protein